LLQNVFYLFMKSATRIEQNNINKEKLLWEKGISAPNAGKFSEAPTGKPGRKRKKPKPNQSNK